MSRSPKAPSHLRKSFHNGPMESPGGYEAGGGAFASTTGLARGGAAPELPAGLAVDPQLAAAWLEKRVHHVHS